MSTTTALAPPAPAPADEPYGRGRLTFGIVGRTWLWFMAGCLLVTLIPILFGWRPFLIESGSMAAADQGRRRRPVRARPTRPTADLVGHVVVFDDPDFPDRVKTHRASRPPRAEGSSPRATPTRPNDSPAVPGTRDRARPAAGAVRRAAVSGCTRASGSTWRCSCERSRSRSSPWAATARRTRILEGPDDDGDLGPSKRGPADPAAARLRPTPPRRSRPPAVPAQPRAGEDPRVPARRACSASASCCWRPTTVAAFASTTKNTGELWTVPNDELHHRGHHPRALPLLEAATRRAPRRRPRTRRATVDRGRTTRAGRPPTSRASRTAPWSRHPRPGGHADQRASCINTTSTTAITGPQIVHAHRLVPRPGDVRLRRQAASASRRRGRASRRRPRGRTTDTLHGRRGKSSISASTTAATSSSTSPSALNNNAWHMAVATQGTGGHAALHRRRSRSTRARTRRQRRRPAGGAWAAATWPAGAPSGRAATRPGTGLDHRRQPTLPRLDGRDHRLLRYGADRGAGLVPLLGPLTRSREQPAPPAFGRHVPSLAHWKAVRFTCASAARPGADDRRSTDEGRHPPDVRRDDGDLHLRQHVHDAQHRRRAA